MLAAVDELLEPLAVEPDHEVVAMGDHGNAHPAAQTAPLPECLNVLRNVQLLELASPLREPILGLLAVVSPGDGVDFDPGHRTSSFLR